MLERTVGWGATISAHTVWGVIRGLETFGQMIYAEETHGGLVT